MKWIGEHTVYIRGSKNPKEARVAILSTEEIGNYNIYIKYKDFKRKRDNRMKIEIGKSYYGIKINTSGDNFYYIIREAQERKTNIMGGLYTFKSKRMYYTERNIEVYKTIKYRAEVYETEDWYDFREFKGFREFMKYYRKHKRKLIIRQIIE